jgi:ribose/xylose/arabinose/galactoside ABC-type transport system permease subunit
VFFIGNPAVFSQWSIYRAVLIGLPVVLFVVVPLVFVVTVGEIDLSFPATIGMSCWVFALVVQAGYDPFLGMAPLAPGCSSASALAGSSSTPTFPR